MNVELLVPRSSNSLTLDVKTHVTGSRSSDVDWTIRVDMSQEGAT